MLHSRLTLTNLGDLFNTLDHIGSKAYAFDKRGGTMICILRTHHLFAVGAVKLIPVLLICVRPHPDGEDIPTGGRIFSIDQLYRFAAKAQIALGQEWNIEQLRTLLLEMDGHLPLCSDHPLAFIEGVQAGVLECLTFELQSHRVTHFPLSCLIQEEN